MDRRYVVEHDLVRRYLRGELPESEKAAFEVFYLTDPETQTELELMARLGEPAPEAPLRSRPGAPAVDEEEAARRFERPRRWFPALAASLVAFVAGAALTLTIDRGRFDGGIGNVQELVVERLRGAAVANRITVGAERGALLVRVPVGEPGLAAVVRLEPAGGQVRLLEGLVSDGYGELTFLLPRDELPEGRVRLVALREDGGAPLLATAIELTLASE